MSRSILSSKGLIPVYLILAVVIVGLAIFGGSQLAGGEEAATATDGVYRYPVKVVCAPKLGPAKPALVPGTYKTAVNVLNSSREDANIMKSLTLSVGMGKSPISGDAMADMLVPRAALDIDCRDLAGSMWGLKGIKVPGGKGYVIIESDQQLTVTAVYTSLAKTKVGAGQSIDVENVEGIWDTRSIFAPPLFPDLIVTLDPDSSVRIECENAGDCSIHDVSFEMKNIGPADAGPFEVLFEFSGGESATYREDVGLAAGASGNVGIGFGPDTDCYIPDTASATCTVTATIDTDAEVEESDETNNVDVVAYRHEYEAVSAPAGIEWADANAAAEALTRNGLQGHLAVITSPGENDLVSGLLSAAEAWIGGFQPPGSAEPHGGWEWVNGEPFSFSAWQGGQPDNSPAEADGISMELAGWKDISRGSVPPQFLVEYE